MTIGLSARKVWRHVTPEAFIAKWSEATTKERAAAQEHFIDLCRLLGQPTPNEVDPIGEWFAFERGVTKTGGERGWADVWKRGCFGWEYKGKGKNLKGALAQLQLYALALESPPLLIVSDIDSIEIHTAFQNAVQDVHRIALAEMVKPELIQKLRWAFTEPERLRPKRTRTSLCSFVRSISRMGLRWPLTELTEGASVGFVRPQGRCFSENSALSLAR
jgi:hypothetical protein